jgi:hypothetical protein
MIRWPIGRLIARIRVALERRAHARQDRHATRTLQALPPIRLTARRHQRFTEDRRP